MIAGASVGRMPQYGVEHAAALAVILVAVVVCTTVAKRASDEARVERVLTLAGWAMLAASTIWMLWQFLPANWTIEQSLPFHFSDAMRFVTAIALITRSGWSVAVLYFWGLTLNMQSVLTPDLNYQQSAALEFAMYWLLHAVPLIAAVTLTWGLAYRPTWRGYGVAFAFTALWAGMAFVVNLMTGANYGYMSGAPAGRSLLDLLGPWPLYIAWEAVLVAGAWALMTWPWTSRPRIVGSAPADRYGLIRRRCRPALSQVPARLASARRRS
ncbi:YwaF family protein [Pseudoclavibacter endophyticus]|uniref:YwaF family protein n=1 Tax=Pseudoclavibacter endophyticus TaxID=1778590 RepID=UPI001CE415FF|nr:TIGR02206 family membrane protein [Pseudoclavibacter endophyticus]